jgi:hypothetical protein
MRPAGRGCRKLAGHDVASRPGLSDTREHVGGRKRLVKLLLPARTAGTSRSTARARRPRARAPRARRRCPR